MRVTQAGVFASRTVHAAGVGCFLVAGAFMLPAVLLRGWPLTLLLVSSCAAGYAYTGGPFPLGYHGMGDVTVIVFFGFVATGGMRYVQGGGDVFMSWPTALASLQVGLLCAVLLAINNLRDVTTDALVGKSTLPVIFGLRFGRWEVTALLGLPYALNACWLATVSSAADDGGKTEGGLGQGGNDRGAGGAWGIPVRWGCVHAAALTSLTLPMAVRIARRVWAYVPPTPRFNALLAEAAALHLLFGSLLAAGIVLDDAPLYALHCTGGIQANE